MKKIIYILFLIPSLCLAQLKTDPLSKIDSAINSRIGYAANGNVAIGNITPATKLHIKYDVEGYNAGLTVENLLGNASIDFRGKGNTWQVGVVRSDATGLQKGFSIYNFRYGSSGGTAIGIDSLNNIGINTTTPAVPLDVNGQVKITSISTTIVPLEVVSATRGIVPPQLTTAQRNSIDGALPGEYIYNTDTGELNYWDATVGIWRRVVKNDLPPEYADNAAALAGNLQIGDRYRTGDALKVVH